MLHGFLASTVSIFYYLEAAFCRTISVCVVECRENMAQFFLLLCAHVTREEALQMTQ
jgi:hypothetical protein